MLSDYARRKIMEEADTPHCDIELTEADIIEDDVGDDLLAPDEARQETSNRDHERAVATNLELIRQRGELIADLETALNACRGYAGVMERMHLPDPYGAGIDALLTKYKMNGPREWPSGKLWSVGEKSIPARSPVPECTCSDWELEHREDCPRGKFLIEKASERRQEINDSTTAAVQHEISERSRD